MTNVDLSSKSYKEVQALYTEATGLNAVGKKRDVLEAALQYVDEPVEVVVEEIKMTDADIIEAVAEQKEELVFKSVSARIRHMYFEQGEKQAVIAKACGVVPQMVSNVVRAEKAKRLEAEAAQDDDYVDEEQTGDVEE